MFWAELLVVLAMLIIGARYGGIFLGMSSGFAIAIFVRFLTSIKKFASCKRVDYILADCQRQRFGLFTD